MPNRLGPRGSMPANSSMIEEKVTIADIARECNVSPATVSLALRNKPGVGDETRRRVLETAQTLGYIFSPSQKTQTPSHAFSNIGMVVKVQPDDVPPLANNFYASVLSGVEMACQREQIGLFYTTLAVDENNNPVAPPQLLTEQQADGLLMVGAYLNGVTIAMLERLGAPVVLIDGYASNNAYDSVVSDNVTGAYNAVSYLIAKGHRHIGIVGSHPDSFPSIRERRAGYLKALREHELTPYVVDSSLSPPEAAERGVALLREQPQISAIFGCNDEVAIAVMRAAEDLGRSVPEELSIIGFDDIDLGQHVRPALTTMHIDKVGMGRLAVRLLLERADYPESGRICAQICAQLIERDSVQPPPVDRN